MSSESAAERKRDGTVGLPADRAFVVQLRRPARSGTGAVWAGRVEHVVSGRSARFDGCDELRRFVEELLAPEPGSSTGEEPT